MSPTTPTPLLQHCTVQGRTTTVQGRTTTVVGPQLCRAGPRCTPHLSVGTAALSTDPLNGTILLVGSYSKSLPSPPFPLFPFPPSPLPPFPPFRPLPTNHLTIFRSSYVFDQVRSQTDREFTIKISYLEIYNDEGYDLLDPNHEITKMEDLPKVSIMDDGTRGHCTAINMTHNTLNMRHYTSTHTLTTRSGQFVWLNLGPRWKIRRGSEVAPPPSGSSIRVQLRGLRN